MEVDRTWRNGERWRKRRRIRGEVVSARGEEMGEVKGQRGEVRAEGRRPVMLDSRYCCLRIRDSQC